MRIAQSLIDEMVAHARADLPNECCGMVGGVDGEASVVIPVVNSAASPLRFEMDPQGQYNALKAIEDDGKEMLAIYHSHTKTAAYPSQTDVNFARGWPGVEWLIVGVPRDGEPTVRSYRIDDGVIEEVEVQVDGG